MGIIEPILLFGAGVFLGTLVSIITLDRIYKGVMKRALDEIHKNYKIALDHIKK